MADEFDPYHKWLGISLKEQPPNDYRLLGIKCFENDPDVMESAADQRMTHLRSFQSGRNASHSQKLLNEVSAARVRLLDDAKRAEYDEQLRRQLETTKSSTGEGVVEAELAGAAAEPEAESELIGRSTSSPQTSGSAEVETKTPWNWRLPAAIGGILVFLVVVIAVIGSGFGNGKLKNDDGGSQNDVSDNGGTASSQVKSLADPSSPNADNQEQDVSNEDVSGEPPVEPDEPTNGDGQSKDGSTDVPTNHKKGEANNGGDTTTAPDSGKKEEVDSSTETEAATKGEGGSNDTQVILPRIPLFDRMAGEVAYLDPLLAETGRTLEKPIDVLKQVDPQRDAVHGNWRFEDGCLILPLDKWVRLQLPTRVPTEYRLIVEGTPHLEKTALFLGLVGQHGQFSVGIDHTTEDTREISQTLHLLDGKHINETTKRRRMLVTGQTARIVCQVLSDRVSVVVNDITAIDWPGDQRRLSLQREWQVPHRDRLWIGSYFQQGGGRGWSLGKITLVPIVKQGSAEQETPFSIAGELPEIPSAKVQEELLQALASIYKPSDATTPQAKLKMAAELYNVAVKTTENHNERFSLLRSSMSLAQLAGDAAMMLAAIEAMESSFQIDGVEARHKAMLDLAKSATTEASIKSLVENEERVINEALSAGRVDLAETLAAEIYNSASSPDGKAVRKEAYDQRRRVHEAYEKWQALQAALAQIETNPANAPANLVAGRWYCFEKNDWKTGLPFLAKSSDEALRALAVREQTSPPKNTEEEVSLGDAWWDAAPSVSADDRPDVLRRAGHWYTLAHPKVTSTIDELKLKKRLEQLERTE